MRPVTSPSRCVNSAPTGGSPGSNDQLPLMVDSERGVGRPDRALELGRSVDRSTLPAAVQVGLAIAMSGARLDLGQPELALAELEIPQLDPDRAFSYSPALFSAYAEVLAELGRDQPRRTNGARAPLAPRRRWAATPTTWEVSRSSRSRRRATTEQPARRWATAVPTRHPEGHPTSDDGRSASGDPSATDADDPGAVLERRRRRRVLDPRSRPPAGTGRRRRAAAADESRSDAADGALRQSSRRRRRRSRASTRCFADLDGVVYAGAGTRSRTPSRASTARRRERAVGYITNNASRSDASVAAAPRRARPRRRARRMS